MGSTVSKLFLDFWIFVIFTRSLTQEHNLGAVAEWVRALACTGDRTVLAGFESHCGQLRFGTLAIPFTPLCQCLSEETLKAVGLLLSLTSSR